MVAPEPAIEVEAAQPLKAAPSAGEEEAVGPEPGAPAENGHTNGDAAESVAASSKDDSGEPAEEELWRKRLWFVRIPKPPEVGAIKALEQELETYRAQYKLLTESFNVKKVERDAARQNTRAARDAFKACLEAYEAKRAIVQPMRDAAASTSEEAKKLRGQFSELDVRSEAELDERLQQLHYRIEHESIPLNEEKRILQQIKKLDAQRQKVREYEASVSTLAESRTEVKRLEGELAEHKAELAALQGEKNLQHTILQKFREQEDAIDKDVDEILAERKRVKEILDEAYARVSELKSTQKAKNDEFYTNRRFSRTIREMLGSGKLEEARNMCTQQMEEAHVKISSDADYRAEYFALWEQQRKNAVSMAMEEEEEAAASKRGGRRQERQPAVEPAKKAEQVIAAVLEEAKGEIMRVKAAAASAAAAAAAAAATPAVAEASLGAAPAAEEPEPAPKPAAKPPRPKKEVPRHVVELPSIPADNFELPEVIKAKKVPSAEELKALEREHQLQVQADAERRRQRRQQELEKRRQRALREQQAAAKAKQAVASAALDSDTAPEPSGDEGGSKAAGAAGAATAAEQAPAAAEAVQPTAAGKAAAAKPSKVAALTSKPKPAAKRPHGAKKGSLLKQVNTWFKENPVLAVVAAMAVLMLLLAVFVLRG